MMDWKQLEKEMGFEIVDRKPLKGGDISAVYRITSHDSKYVLKINDSTAGRLFRAEKYGMKLLANAGALMIPKIIAIGALDSMSYLLMEYVEPGNKNQNTFKAFGKALAHLHNLTQASYGLNQDNWIGTLPQSNREHDNWEEFYLHERIEPQLELAQRKGLLDTKETPSKSSILTTAKEIFCASSPSLLHGDLWNGNYLITDNGAVALIDPAVYYGHPMMDIGMTKLFGGFEPDFYTSYFANSEITGNIDGQIDLAQLYYLLVHLNLFGIQYKSQVIQILNHYF